MLRALGLGDLLTGVPALRAIARAFPQHRRTLVAPASFAPLLGLLPGVVTDVCHADFRLGVGAIPARAAGPDVAVNLHGRGPQSHRVLLEAGARALIAFANPDVPPPAAAATQPQWDPDEHEMQRWCRLLDGHGISADPRDWRLDVAGVHTAAHPVGPPEVWRDAAVLHPGAASAARRWPLERWAEVARALADAGHRVVVTGSAGERARGLDLARRAGLRRAAVLAGRTDLRVLARGLGAARLLVSGDTGVAHLGTAVGLSSVLLFGPTSPMRWGPPPDQDGRHLVLWKGVTGDPHAGRPDPGLLAITVADVLDGVRALAVDQAPTI